MSKLIKFTTGLVLFDVPELAYLPFLYLCISSNKYDILSINVKIKCISSINYVF